MGLWHRYSWMAYLAIFVGVLGHSSTEFVAVLSGMAGPELSVWRFVLGGAGLVVLALLFSDSRDLITPIKEQGVRIVLLSVLGVTIAYLFFHWSLDFASVVQVATLVTTIPIFVGISNLLTGLLGGEVIDGVAEQACTTTRVTANRKASSKRSSGTSWGGVILQYGINRELRKRQHKRRHKEEYRGTPKSEPKEVIPDSPPLECTADGKCY